MTELFKRLTELSKKKVTVFFKKDLAKSKLANKFIGIGAKDSSTGAYMLAAKELANCSDYSANDIVFISANGKRENRYSPPLHEITLACSKQVVIVTDTSFHRNRDYNVGEREISLIISNLNYVEIADGLWAPKSNPISMYSDIIDMYKNTLR